MESYSIYVENIKCGGCANSITSKLTQIDGVDNTTVDIEFGKVTVSADETTKSKVVSALKSMGYPETDSVAGFDNIKAKATSFVSCAIGRMQKDD